MAELIYTKTNPYELLGQHRDLVMSIKKDGIKYPVLGNCNNRKLNKGFLEVGNQRLLIALALGLDEIPAILYSVHHKTGFDGIPITSIDDIMEICDESLQNEPVYNWIISALRTIKLRNHYPPDPLKIQAHLDK